jgi:hypothetical protein
MGDKKPSNTLKELRARVGDDFLRRNYLDVAEEKFGPMDILDWVTLYYSSTMLTGTQLGRIIQLEELLKAKGIADGSIR